MIPKRFQDIAYSDLEALINNQVPEGKTIEYKRELVTSANTDKEPFLEGVSAFANTIGGDFIIGIEEEKGLPVKLTGISLEDADAEILRLHQMLQTGLEPRLPPPDIKEIQGLLAKNELPALLVEGGIMVVHLIPMSAFTQFTNLSVGDVHNYSNLSLIGIGWNKKINLDGVVSYSGDITGSYSYSQFFRNGSVELVYVIQTRKPEKYIPIKYLEDELIKVFKDKMIFLKYFGIEPPVYLYLSFLNIKDYEFLVHGDSHSESRYSDRNNLFLPTLLIDNFETDPAELLRPVFDWIWNAYGFSRCFNYSENGKRKS